MEISNYWDGQMDFIWAIHLISLAVFIGLNITKVQLTQGIEYFDSFNTFSSKQELQLALKTSVCFFLAKGKKYMEHLWQIV